MAHYAIRYASLAFMRESDLLKLELYYLANTYGLILPKNYHINMCTFGNAKNFFGEWRHSDNLHTCTHNLLEMKRKKKKNNEIKTTHK